jgi:hypothetical protein
MANFLNGFLDNLLNGALSPRGDLSDYRHASYLYNQNSFALAPRHKFLYHVVFEPSAEALNYMPQLSNRNREEINMLVKSVDLPQFNAEIETKNQYNRKKNVQTAISYDPIQLVFHDDNVGITTSLLEAYYRYYYEDGNLLGNSSAYDPRSTYKSSQLAKIDYGMTNKAQVPFFRRITVFQLARQRFTGFTLVNPIIASWGHDSLDNADSQPTANTIRLAYEAVHYTRGNTGEDSPAGFAKSHYDKLPSSIRSTTNDFGNGGVLGTVGDILTDVTTGNTGLSTILKGIDLFRNSKTLTTDQLRTDGVRILENFASTAIRSSPLFINSNTATNSLSGVANTSFPKSAGPGAKASEISAQGGAVDTNSAVYAERIAQARENNR